MAIWTASQAWLFHGLHPLHVLIYLDHFTVPTGSQSQPSTYWSRQPMVFWRLMMLWFTQCQIVKKLHCGLFAPSHYIWTINDLSLFIKTNLQYKFSWNWDVSIQEYGLRLLVCDLNRTPNCYGKTWRLLCPFFSNLHLRENLVRDCFTSTASTVTNSVQSISLPVYVIVTNTRLQPLTTTIYNSMLVSFSLLKINDVWLNNGAFCAPCMVEGSALVALQTGVVCSTSLMASLRSTKHPADVARVGPWDSLRLARLKQYHIKFKFK